MRLDPKEEGLVTGRQILLRFHERSAALHVAQSHALPRQPAPSTCSAWKAAPEVARSCAAHRAARKVCCVTFSGESFSEVSAATTALL